ncbi:hypothetical protein HDU93_006337 [Gonapodya sp. JEL0774]|nr:hypothetical protein HDU93_006337 [Gonapodya sp. JEL0774]
MPIGAHRDFRTLCNGNKLVEASELTDKRAVSTFINLPASHVAFYQRTLDYVINHSPPTNSDLDAVLRARSLLVSLKGSIEARHNQAVNNASLVTTYDSISGCPSSLMMKSRSLVTEVVDVQEEGGTGELKVFVFSDSLLVVEVVQPSWSESMFAWLGWKGTTAATDNEKPYRFLRIAEFADLTISNEEYCPKNVIRFDVAGGTTLGLVFAGEIEDAISYRSTCLRVVENEIKRWKKARISG